MATKLSGWVCLHLANMQQTNTKVRNHKKMPAETICSFLPETAILKYRVFVIPGFPCAEPLVGRLYRDDTGDDDPVATGRYPVATGRYPVATGGLQMGRPGANYLKLH